MHTPRHGPSLERLLRPERIAVFGGSWAANVVEQCQKLGFAGELWPVHPTRESVRGLVCFPDIDSLPGVPDAAFIGVNAVAAIEIVRELAAVGAGGAVCFAAGFSEVVAEDPEGAARQQRLLRAGGSMPVLGPNCYGYINALDGAALWPDQHGAVRVDSGVALLTQSSNVAINLTMQQRGLPVAMVLTAGNQAQVPLAHLAAQALEDDRITAIGLHVEGFSDIPAWESLAARSRVLGKPVVVLRVGRTEASRQAVMSHTSSLAGSTAASDAFIARLGVHQVKSLAVFLETLKVLHVAGPLPSNRLYSMSCSGGEAALMADAADAAGMVMPELTPAQTAGLRDVLGSGVALANPLDYNTWIWNDAAALESMISSMLVGHSNIAVLVLDFPRSDRCDPASWQVTLDALVQAGRQWDGTLCVLSTLEENLPESAAIALSKAGVVCLLGMDHGLAALAAAKANAPTSHAACLASVIEDARTVRLLHESDAKVLLAKAGVRVPGLRVGAADDPEFATMCLTQLAVPLVAKGLGLAHKSESGAVITGIDSRESLVSALQSVVQGVENGQRTVLVEEQINEVLVELLVGFTEDPVHGYVLTIGAGGIHTELLRDTAHALLPVTTSDVEKMLSGLRIAPLLDGYRGNAPVARTALIGAIMSLQRFVIAAQGDLVELEVNPLLCTAEEAVVCDAMMRTRAIEDANPR